MMNDDDIVFRLRKRAEIRRHISSRKSVQEGKPDRISDLLEEAANEISLLRSTQNNEVVTFVDAVIAGTTLITEIDNWVESWHTTISTITLHEHLGLTFSEYGMWVQNPECIGGIIEAIQNKRFRV